MSSIAFSNTTDKNGIIQLCEFNCGLGDAGISGNATLLKYFTAFANQSLSEVWHSIFTTSKWQFDDSNQTDLPQATTNLVSGTQKYALPTGALTIERIEIADSEGNFFVLTPLYLHEINEAVSEFFEGGGSPRYYRLIGNTIELFPAPNYNYTNGLKVYFDRGMVTFASSDTTKTPGFASEYHDLVPTKTSIKWLRINKPDSATLQELKIEEARRMGELSEFYSGRWPDKKPVMTPFRNNAR